MNFSRLVPRLVLPALALSLAGCSVGNGSRGVPVAAAGISGKAFGGQQPIAGSTVQLYAVGTSGPSSSTALLSPAVVTDALGQFNLTNKYQCNSSNDLVYLVATGGNPGLADGTNNSRILLLSALGNCGSLPGISYLTVNELTTAAAIFSLAPFMPTPTQIGDSGDDTALRAAFAAAQTAVSITTGQATGSTDGQTRTNTIGNVLASCVNSNGSGSACGNLNQYTGGATDVASAALYMANNPGTNVTQLFNNQLPNSPFSPHLTGPPANWRISSIPSAATPQIDAVSTQSNATITITDTTPDAVIHYTLDGTVPTSTSPTYSQPIVVSNTVTVSAIATSPTLAVSDVARRVVYVYNAPIGHIFAPGVTGTARLYVSRSGYFYGYDCAGSLPYATIQNHLSWFLATSTGVAYQTDSLNQQGVGGEQVVCNASGTSLSSAGSFNSAGCSLGNGYNCLGFGQRTDLDATLYRLGGNTGYVTLADVAFGYVLGPNGQKISVTYAGSSQNQTYYSIQLNGTATAATYFTVVEGLPVTGFFSLTVDSAGTAYWIDPDNHRVLKMTQSGVISRVAGTGGTASSGDGGSPLAAGMDPWGVAVDANGVVYIFDKYSPDATTGGTVRRIKDNVIYSIAGGGSTAIPSNGNAVSMNGAFLFGRAFSVDRAGKSVYVSDSDNIVQITISN